MRARRPRQIRPDRRAGQAPRRQAGPGRVSMAPPAGSIFTPANELCRAGFIGAARSTDLGFLYAGAARPQGSVSRRGGRINRQRVWNGLTSAIAGVSVRQKPERSCAGVYPARRSDPVWNDQPGRALGFNRGLSGAELAPGSGAGGANSRRRINR